MKIAQCIEVSGFLLPVPAPGSAHGALSKEKFAMKKNEDRVPWPEDDPSQGLIMEQAAGGQSHPHPNTNTLLSTGTASARTPEQMQGTFKGEGGEHNSKGCPKHP